LFKRSYKSIKDNDDDNDDDDDGDEYDAFDDSCSDLFKNSSMITLYVTDEVACTDPEVCQRVCDNPAGCSNIAFPKLVLELLPVGMRSFCISIYRRKLFSLKKDLRFFITGMS